MLENKLKMTSSFLFQISKLGIIIIIHYMLACKQNELNLQSSEDKQINHLSKTTDLKANLYNTKWVSNVVEECSDSLIFKDGDRFTFVKNCELMDSTFGVWEIRTDTLIIEEIGSFYNHNFNDKNFVDIDKLRWKAIISDSTIILKVVYSWDPMKNNFREKPFFLDETLNTFKRIK